MRAVYQQLAALFPACEQGPVLFIGMAETAVGFGAGVFDEVRGSVSDPVYLTSTRHPVEGGELLCEFKENHSHATDHLLYLPQDAELRRRVLEAKTVVLIDDEATTGNTFINLLQALQQDAGLHNIARAITVTLTDWSGDALAQRSPIPIQYVSLVQGDWHWEKNPDAPVPVMPAVNVTATGSVPITGKQSWAAWAFHRQVRIWGAIFRRIQGRNYWCWAAANLSGSPSCWLNAWKNRGPRLNSAPPPVRR